MGGPQSEAVPAETEGVVPITPWVEAERRADSVDPRLLRALDGAMREVRRGRPLPHLAAASPDDLAAHTDSLHSEIRALLAGRRPDVAAEPTAGPLRKALIGALRAAFLDKVAALPEPPSSAQLIHVLRTFEEIQRAMDQDPAHQFVSRLSGPDGLELIVEVAHDLRSPLSSILFLAETLRKGQSGALNGVQERQLGLVYSAAFGLSAMASDVIELAHGGDRLLDAHPIPFSVSDILRAVRDIVQPMAEEKGLEVRLEPPEGDIRLGHPAALNRVLLNLTTNALKFTEHGTVHVGARQSTRTNVLFSVQDTGRGIPPEVLTTLFEPFRRRRASEYSFSSAGLGLSICRRLVSAMHSELQLETSPDTGTRFSFELELPLASRL
jgi:signal transduction histidine kinase